MAGEKYNHFSNKPTCFSYYYSIFLTVVKCSIGSGKMYLASRFSS